MPFLSLSHNFDGASRAMRAALRRFPSLVQSGLDRVARGMRTDLRHTVQTWDHDVEFDINTRQDPDSVSVTIGTYDEVFGLLDRGTRGPYPIRPKRPGGVLAFQEGYRPKTIPGRIRSVPGGPFGDIIFAKAVMHPGIKPRRFLHQVVQKWMVKLPRIMRVTLRWGDMIHRRHV